MLITLQAVAVLLLVGLFACKKEVVPTPVVQFVRPFTNQAFEYGDTILVEASVSHPDLQSISLNLVDDAFKAVESPIVVAVTGNATNVNSSLIITNRAITSGKHYVQLKITAGGEQFNFFRDINVFELPKQRFALYVASTPNGPTSRWLIKLESNNVTFGTTLPGDISGLAANSYDGSIFMAPGFNGPLLEFSAVSDSVIFEDPNKASGGAPFMTGIRNSGSDVYAFYGTGAIVQYGYGGKVIRLIQLPNNFRADDALFVNNTLIVHATDGVQSKLFFYPASGTSLIRQMDVPQNQEHIRLEPYANGEFLMLYNNNGQGGWNRYATNGQEVNMPSLPGFKLFDAVSVSASSVVLCTDQGIKRYISSQASLTDLSPHFAKHVEWDEANNLVVYATEFNAYSCSLPSFQQVDSYLIPPHPQDIVLIYNK